MTYRDIHASDWRRTSWLESLDANDPWTRLAIKETESSYGDKVSVDVKKKSLLKFGQTTAAGAEVEVLVGTLGTSQSMEDYVSDNLITHVASSSTSVVGAAVIEGHTISGGNFTFVTQNVTLDGQTKTALTTPLARASRIYNNSTADWASNVYVARDVTFTSGIPQTSSAIHLVGVGTENQSLKGATTFSSVDYAFITKVYASVNKKATASADIRFKVRQAGKVFRTQWEATVDSAAVSFITFEPKPYLIVPKNADVMITAESSGTAVQISGGFNSILAKVV